LTTGEVTLDPSGAINFNSTWSGSLTNTAFSGNDWQTLLSNAANGIRTLDGNDITGATAFDGSVVGEFEITNGGQTLSAISVDKPTTDVLLGDVNLDEAVNFGDISPFIAVLAANGFQAEADIDGSGTVDFSDISPFIVLLSSQ